MESDVEWHWSTHQGAALDQVKKLLTESPTLKYCDPKLPTKTSVDASKSGIGAVLLQKHDDTWAPVAYASRSLSKSEQNYAQIEKEALAILFGWECFRVYLYGKTFTVVIRPQALTWSLYSTNRFVKPRHEFNDFALGYRNTT